MTTGRRALVAFSGHADLWWLRLLRPGFRHCFVALESPGGWIVVDALSHRTEVTHLAPAHGIDLAEWYRDHGLTVVETATRATPRRPAPWRPYSCVESVKRILGIQAGRIVTPRQLFDFLQHEGKNTLTRPGV